MSATLLVPIALLALLLLVAAGDDLRRRVIPNWLTAAIALGAIGWWWCAGLAPWPDVALRIAVALGALLLFAGLFALGAMGGGDVKLIAALALWLAPGQLLRMLLWMGMIGGALTLAMLAISRLRRTGPPEVPYGVAIAGAALLVLANDVLTIMVA